MSVRRVGWGVVGRATCSVLMIVCLAGCTTWGSSGSPSLPTSNSASAATPSRPAAADMQDNFGTTVTVPAGGSVDVPLSFEGTSAAQIYLAASDSSIGASFGATTLTGDLSGAEGGSVGASLPNPLDGPLHITNSGSVSEAVLWACPDSPDRFAKPPRLTSGAVPRIRPA